MLEYYIVSQRIEEIVHNGTKRNVKKIQIGWTDAGKENIMSYLPSQLKKFDGTLYEKWQKSQSNATELNKKRKNESGFHHEKNQDVKRKKLESSPQSNETEDKQKSQINDTSLITTETQIQKSVNEAPGQKYIEVHEPTIAEIIALHELTITEIMKQRASEISKIKMEYEEMNEKLKKDHVALETTNQDNGKRIAELETWNFNLSTRLDTEREASSIQLAEKDTIISNMQQSQEGDLGTYKNELDAYKITLEQQNNQLEADRNSIHQSAEKFSAVITACKEKAQAWANIFGEQEAHLKTFIEQNTGVVVGQVYNDPQMQNIQFDPQCLNVNQIFEPGTQQNAQYSPSGIQDPNFL